MNITYNSVKWEDIKGLCDEYFAELNCMNDGFHEGMMFGGEPFTIELDGKVCGFYSQLDGWNGGKMISSIYVQLWARAYSADILDDLCSNREVTAALVPSNDSNLVSIAFEKMRALGTGFDMQAYNHVFGEPKRPAEFGLDCMEEVSADEYELMNKLTEQQWDGCYGDPNFRFFAIRNDGVTLGYGAICKMTSRADTVDIGNFTLPEHRQKGVGRSMLINLSKIAHDDGKTVVAGCWYHNKESIPTLKSAGFIPANRIFYVKFVHDENYKSQ